MKARNNKTGEIVTNFFMSKEFGTISYLDSSKTLRFAYACDSEWTILEDENGDFDWQSFRAEAAKDILCAIISTKYGLNPEHIDMAIGITDSLIAKLKEKEEK